MTHATNSYTAAMQKLLADYFTSLRMDPKFHLGCGDIRMTLGMQEELCTKVLDAFNAPHGPSVPLKNAAPQGESGSGASPEPADAAPSVGPWKECVYKHPDAPRGGVFVDLVRECVEGTFGNCTDWNRRARAALRSAAGIAKRGTGSDAGPAVAAPVYDPETGSCDGSCDCGIGQACKAYLVYQAKKNAAPQVPGASGRNEGQLLATGPDLVDTPAVAAPGWKLVPIEPTKEMLAAGADAHDCCIDTGFSSDADGNRYDYTTISPDAPSHIYKAMLNASPYATSRPNSEEKP